MSNQIIIYRDSKARLWKSLSQCKAGVLNGLRRFSGGWWFSQAWSRETMLIEKHKVIWLCADELSSSWIPSYVLKEDEEIVKYPYLLLHEEMRIVVFKGGGGSELRNQIHYECWMAIEVIFWSVNKSKNKGLISADRRTKPTLMLTIPRSY